MHLIEMLELEVSAWPLYKSDDLVKLNNMPTTQNTLQLVHIHVHSMYTMIISMVFLTKMSSLLQQTQEQDVSVEIHVECIE